MARFEAQLDMLYNQFVDTRRHNPKGVTAERSPQHMADGRAFIGQQAVLTPAWSMASDH